MNKAFYRKIMLPLRIMQLAAALFLGIGCFLGFPNDAQMGGFFWLATFAMLVLEVIKRVQNGRSRKRFQRMGCRPGTCPAKAAYLRGLR